MNIVADSAKHAPSSLIPEPIAVGRREAAAMLGISERLLWTWTNTKTIPHARIGARVLYPVEGLRKWLEERVEQDTR